MMICCTLPLSATLLRETRTPFIHLDLAPYEAPPSPQSLALCILKSRPRLKLLVFQNYKQRHEPPQLNEDDLPRDRRAASSIFHSTWTQLQRSVLPLSLPVKVEVKAHCAARAPVQSQLQVK